MRRILIVDDDLHAGQAIRVWLKEHDFRGPRRSGERLSRWMATPEPVPSAGGGETQRSWNEDRKGDQRAARLGICSSIGRRCPATTR